MSQEDEIGHAVRLAPIYALIPLFLEHPEFALRVQTVVKDSTRPRGLCFNANTARQPGLAKNTSRTKRCQITSRRN